MVNFDCIAPRDEAGGDRTILGSKQIAQLKADCSATDAWGIVVSSTKAFMQDSAGNRDGFTHSAITEQNDLINFFSALPQTVIMITNDDHILAHSESPDPNPFTCLTISSISQDIKTGKTPAADQKFIKMDFSNCYGLLTIDDSAHTIKVEAVNVFGDRCEFGRMNEGDKVLS